MSQSLRFPVAVHTMLALACNRDRYLSSELIAQSVNTNAVVVRRILAALKKRGLVKSQGGVQGGAMLAMEPHEITLLDISDAVEEAPPPPVHKGNKSCVISRAVRCCLPRLMGEADDARRKSLRESTLDQLVREVGG